MFLLYDLALIASALILIPYFSLRALRKGTGRIGLRQRLGFISQEKLEAIRGPQVFWIHAVSVGETRAAPHEGLALLPSGGVQGDRDRSRHRLRRPRGRPVPLLSLRPVAGGAICFSENPSLHGHYR